MARSLSVWCLLLVCLALLVTLLPSASMASEVDLQQADSEIEQADRLLVELDADSDAELDADSDAEVDLDAETDVESDADAEAEAEADSEEDAAFMEGPMDHGYTDEATGKMVYPADPKYNPPVGTDQYAWWQQMKDNAAGSVAADALAHGDPEIEEVAARGSARPVASVMTPAPGYRNGKPVYVYEQSTGRFFFPGGKVVQCYAGLKQRANIPSAQCIPQEGPLPTGEYQITARVSTLHGENAPSTMILQQNPKTSCGRGLFRIHRGDFPWPTKQNPHPAFGNFYHSAGCIVMPDVRDRMQIQAPAILTVVPGPWPVKDHVQTIYTKWRQTGKGPGW